MTSKLEGKKVAFLATDGFEQIELTRPWKDIKAAGADIELVSLKKGKIQGFRRHAGLFVTGDLLHCHVLYSGAGLDHRKTCSKIQSLKTSEGITYDYL